MFDKYGEFDSAEELNREAEALRAAGDEKSLKELTKENGLDPEDAEDYMDGYVDALATILTAAIGKLRIESEHLKLKLILLDWVDELIGMCTEDAQLAVAIRKKGQRLSGYMAALVEEGYKNRAEVSKEITDQTKQVKSIMGNHALSIGMPDKRTRKQIAYAYYLGKQVG